MTYIEWEKELLGYLRSQPQDEKEEILAYYREMYGDKHDAGLSDEEIIKNFGEPKLCAAKIIIDASSEQDGESSEKIDTVPPVQDETNAGEENTTSKKEEALDRIKEFFKELSLAKIVGWFFLGILVIIPLAAIVISVIAAFAAVTLAGAALLVGGAVMAVISPLSLIFGYSVVGMIATLGSMLILSGLGGVIFFVFYYITKYSIISCYKLIKYCIKGRNKK